MQKDNIFHKVRAPLFDRLSYSKLTDVLVDDTLGLYNLEDVKYSVAQNLEYLLNTRLHPAQVPGTPPTVIDYGLPDTTTLSTGDFNQVRKLTNVMRERIEFFEPRLRNVRVEVIPVKSDDPDQSIRIQLTAMLHVEPLTEDVKFYLVVQSKYGMVNVYEGE
ncbi:MAG: type VI secretion system baseplate subunit TssE [Candidatus Kapabacteria bacterium]|nr:type VI secretion system baseplate subunit TssE [Candidatus Kapabacteria bacterium]MBX7154352.1 type VI secretion system baseplate subunit TssE [Bacteroidota bacterium]